MNKNRLRLILLVLLIAVAAVGAYFSPEAFALVRAFGLWVKEHPLAGASLFILLYIPAAVAMAPGTPIALTAGWSLGLFGGVVAMSLGSTLGASAAFVTGRFLAREWVRRKLHKATWFPVLERVVEENGFQVVLLTRLSPLFPFNLLNYAYGFTGVSFRNYFLASWLGMLPGTILYVYLGASLADVQAFWDRPAGRTPYETGFFYFGLVMTGLSVYYISRQAQKILRRRMTEEEKDRI